MRALSREMAVSRFHETVLYPVNRKDFMDMNKYNNTTSSVKEPLMSHASSDKKNPGAKRPR